MHIFRRVALASAALLSGLFGVCVSAPAQCPQPTHDEMEIFGSVQYIEKLHGPVGLELTLKEDGHAVSGVLLDYGGQETPSKTQLQGQLSGCSVTLAGKGSHGLIKVSGSLGVAALQGELYRHIGKRWYSQKIYLKRQISEKPAVVASSLLYKLSSARAELPPKV